jgi:hypothetical protein
MSNSQDLEHVNSESSDAVVDTSAQKQSKKRVITAARKEQNKLAQRAYSEFYHFALFSLVSRQTATVSLEEHD